MSVSPDPMPPLPPVGRRFSRSRPVRLGDVDPAGFLRLDALTRYTQDVSNDDTSDAELADHLDWVVRSTMVDVHAEAAFGERLTLTTFCGALGKRWAQRRITIEGDAGARYEVATLWIFVDPTSGRPRRLSDQFVELYGDAAEGRTIGARLGHPRPDDAAEREPWPVRRADCDTVGHVNNAAYWTAAEEFWAAGGRAGWRYLTEYGGGIPLGATAQLVRSDDLLWFEVDGAVAASTSRVELGPV